MSSEGKEKKVRLAQNFKLEKSSSSGTKPQDYIPSPVKTPIKTVTTGRLTRGSSLPNLKSSAQKESEEFEKRFDVKEKIGAGAFGDVKRGIDKTTKEEVAIKLEKNEKGKVSSVATEAALYRKLDAAPWSGPVKGIPRILFAGMHNDHHVLVMEMLGPNLEKLLIKCGRKFTLKTTIQIAIQLLDRIQFFHETRLIHRDIKPENFVIGKHTEKNVRKRNLIHIIDFGLSKLYVDPITLHHIPYKTGKDLTGTARYVSIRTHDGKEQSRRDDIEAIGHLLIYFMKGQLPWQGLQIKQEVDPKLDSKAKNKIRYKLIAETKKAIPIEKLCEGIPKEFARYMNYARNELMFIDCPDYDFLRNLFQDLFVLHNYEEDDLYDWDYNDSQLAVLRGSHDLKRSPSVIKIKSGSIFP